MSEDFRYDVFLSHSSKDKAVIQEIAGRLHADGVRVWLADWNNEPSDSLLAKTKKALGSSRVLVLCISQSVVRCWAMYEADTFRFRDPQDKHRRFVPLRLDHTPVPEPMAQFACIDWRPEKGEESYGRLLEACRPPVEEDPTGRQGPERIIKLEGAPGIWSYAFSADGKHAVSGSVDDTVRLWDLETGRCLHVLKGHGGPVYGVAWSPDGRRALSGSDDSTIRLWDLETGRCLRTLEGHRRAVYSVAWSPDGRRALSGSDDSTIRLWDLETGRCLCTLEGHRRAVLTVTWSKDGRRALCGSGDNAVRLWDLETSCCLCFLEGHGSFVYSVAWSPDGRRGLSGSRDSTIRLWDLETGRCQRVLEGHGDYVSSVAWSGDGRYALSGSGDSTIRLWNLETGRCLCILEGHGDYVSSVAWSEDGRYALSGDDEGGVIAWDLSAYTTQTRTSGSSEPKQVQYTNAKVLLVGDSGVGKTGLSNYLARGIKVEDDKPLPSTDGAWATHWPLPHSGKKAGTEREIWLWDFAGQVDYRLVHQLYMDDASVAVLVFNPQDEKLFDGLGKWDRDLQKASREGLAKLLVAGRIDRGSLVVSRKSVEAFMKERDFLGPLHETSSKTGEGCDKLYDAVVNAIDWQSIPKTTSPALYHRMKREILALRDSGLVLIRLSELKQRMEMSLGAGFDPAQLEAVIGLLAGPGMIKRLDFGGFILLQPEVLSRYAAAVVRKVRKHPEEFGCIREDEMLAGDLDYQDFERLPPEDQSVVLRALHETFISRAWCLRQPCGDSAILIFPSYFRRERPEQPTHPSVLVTYRFTGPVEEIYATLVVRLHHTLAFETDQLWKFAADFKTQTGQSLGLKLTLESEGKATLEVYFTPEVDPNSQVLFLRYVHDHLREHAQGMERLRHYFCANKKCKARDRAFMDRDMIDEELALRGSGRVFCPRCRKPIVLRDAVEEKFDSRAIREKVREMQEEGQLAIDKESLGLVAVHHAGSVVSEAGQIYRLYSGPDHGIDAEIEFRDDKGRATGKRLYLQLKSGDSYLRKRQRDDAEVFDIKEPRWAEYWQQQAYPVMLVIRDSKGEIRWMEVSSYLRRTSEGGQAVKQIVFEGERLDVMSVRRWREKALASGS